MDTEIIPDKTPIDIFKEAIVEFVIRNNTCPPLNALLNRLGAIKDGEVDWDKVSEQIIFELYNDSEGLYEGFLNAYTAIGSNPSIASFVFVHPISSEEYDDPNKEFDNRIALVKNRLVLNFIHSTIGSEKHQTIFKMLTNAEIYSGQDKAVFKQLIEMWNSNDFSAKFLVLSTIIENLFAMIYFYGDEIKDSDLIGMESDRGPIERQKFLSRMPQHGLQMVNTAFRDIMRYIRGLNIRKLREHNSALALGIDLNQLEIQMNKFKNQIKPEG